MVGSDGDDKFQGRKDTGTTTPFVHDAASPSGPGVLNILNKVSKARTWKPVSVVQVGSLGQKYYLSKMLLKTSLSVVGVFVTAETSQILHRL